MVMVKLIRRWGFALIAFVSLLVLAACIGAEVFALSAKDVWSCDTLRPINAGSGFAGEYWRMEFAKGGMLLEHVSSMNSNFPFVQISFPHNGQIHHEAYPAEYLNVKAEPQNACSGRILASLGPSAVGFYKGFGHGDLGAYYWKVSASIGPETGEVVAVPIWPISVVAAIVLVLWEMRHWIHRRLHPDRSGMCLKCGYDLRASPERCPECGTAIPVVQLR